MELKCYVFPGWEPRIRPAAVRRDWMDLASESYPNRCLPMVAANGHGWEVLSPCGFEVSWNGGPEAGDVEVRPDRGTPVHEAPVALFGLGTFTLHLQGLFRTPPGWNLFVSGPPNSAKDGVAPLTGLIETDWSPYTFAMSWKLTRPQQIVRFEANEPIAFFFPVQRGLLDDMTPAYASIDEDPGLRQDFQEWSRQRGTDRQRSSTQPFSAATVTEQGLYFRGLTPDGRCPVADHQVEGKVRPFANAELVRPSARPATDESAATGPEAAAALAASEARWKAAKYEWLLETMERQRHLSSAASNLFRVRDLSPDEFLDEFYAPARPVILCGAMDDWPAREKWSASYLRDQIGKAVIECQSGRRANPRFEREMASHKQQMPFDQYIDLIAANPGNDLYVTANNFAANAEIMNPLLADLGAMDGILDHEVGQPAGMVWIGPAGTLTPLHHDLTNNFLAQIVGRKRVIMAPPTETPKLYNDLHVFSEVTNLADPGVDLATYPRLKEVRTMDVTLEPGEILFLPIGWWHQVEALDFSVSMTYTNFVWTNDSYRDHPQRS